MKIVLIIAAACFAGLSAGACSKTLAGAYGSASPMSGYGTVHQNQVNNCGTDLRICYEEMRDRKDRGQQ